MIISIGYIIKMILKLYMNISIYMCVYVCVCMCVWRERERWGGGEGKERMRTHT